MVYIYIFYTNKTGWNSRETVTENIEENNSTIFIKLFEVWTDWQLDDFCCQVFKILKAQSKQEISCQVWEHWETADNVPAIQEASPSDFALTRFNGSCYLYNKQFTLLVLQGTSLCSSVWNLSLFGILTVALCFLSYLRCWMVSETKSQYSLTCLKTKLVNYTYDNYKYYFSCRCP